MSETKFTKENWRLISDFGSNFLGVQIGRQGGFLVQGIDADQAIANAHLIAAAPEMYKEIESDLADLVCELKYCEPSYEHQIEKLKSKINRKSALLAKARGEQQ